MDNLWKHLFLICSSLPIWYDLGFFAFEHEESSTHPETDDVQDHDQFADFSALHLVTLKVKGTEKDAHYDRQHRDGR